MAGTLSNNKRIAKNTLFLYIRMLFLTVIGLFTSRIILNVLGIEDYGVYNAVAGFVSMFTFLTASLSNAISRYLNVTIGNSNDELLKDIFPTSMNIQIIMSIIMAIIIDLVGVWFLNSHMNIPEERIEIANAIFHISIISFVISLISVPYNAAVIAHEHMNFFAYMGIFDGILKLVSAFLLYIAPIDRLLTYSFLLCLIPMLDLFIYIVYCRRHFAECHYRLIFKSNLFREMFSFAGWNFLGSSSAILNNYGVNLIINIFFGVTVNAARGVANQVDGVIRQFITSFTIAINPQIMKSFASGNNDYMNRLIRSGAKYSTFLVLLFAIPFWYEADAILYIWLGNYPEYAPIFVRLTLLGIIIDLSGNSLANAVWATGKVKKYYLVIGPIGLFAIPLTYLFFKIGCPPYMAYVSYIITYSIIQISRIFIAKGYIALEIKQYLNEVYFRPIIVSILPLIANTILFMTLNPGLQRFIFSIISSFFWLIISIWLFGLSNAERSTIKDYVKTKIH